MKLFLKFDHKQNDVFKAIDSPLTRDNVNFILKKIISDYLDDDSLDRESEFCEVVDKHLDYSIILLLASRYIMDEYQKKQMIKVIFKIDEGDEII